MVFYFTVRGLSPSDINKIAVVSALFAPVSIIIFMAKLSEDNNVVFEFTRMMTGQNQIEYNTFVPVFAISVLSIIYLMGFHYKKYQLLIKISLLTILLFLVLFIIYSTSRQAILLVIIYMSLFMAINLSVFRLKNIIYYVIFAAAGYYFYEWFTFHNGENSRLTSRLDEFLNTPRGKMALDGLLMLDITELFTGAGLTSALVSGPHNDYVRWLQRTGLIFTFISFYPYFSVMFKSFFDIFLYKRDRVRLYIFAVSLFVIYNSFFGYPREDAYQSIWCFLGISLWIGYNNYNRRKKIVDAGKLHSLVN